MDIVMSRLLNGGPAGAAGGSMGGALGAPDRGQAGAAGPGMPKDTADLSSELSEVAEMLGEFAGAAIKGLLSSFAGGMPGMSGGGPGGGGGIPGVSDPGGDSSGAGPGGSGAPAPSGAGGAPSSGPASGGGSAPQEVEPFLQYAAQAYVANPSVLKGIAQRESNFNTGDIANNYDSNAKKGTPSKGMFQFIEPTFESMMPQARQANPQAWQGVSENWTDWKAQALTCSWAITHGKGNQWSTYQAAVAGAGGSAA